MEERLKFFPPDSPPAPVPAASSQYGNISEVPPIHQPAGAYRLAVARLAETCHTEAIHTRQVARLALRLFDELHALHGLGEQQRAWLEVAALLHEIGKVEGIPKHHKAGMNIILATPILPFNNKERLIIGSIVRYHRKALPNLAHDHYRALDPAERLMVDRLAALLRLADGLDHTHQSLVCGVKCQVRLRKMVLRCTVRQVIEVEYPETKADLFEAVFRKKIDVQWILV